MIKLLIVTVLLGTSTLFSLCASASSPERQAAIDACRAETKLIHVRIQSAPRSFSKPEETIAVLIQGEKPPPSMKHLDGAELCFYSVRKKYVQLIEWDALGRTKRLPSPIESKQDL